MRLATQTYAPQRKLGFEEGMKAIKAAGFDSVDLSLFRMDQDDNPFVLDTWHDEAMREREILDSIGLECTQAHGPHIFDFADPWIMENTVMPRMLRSMEIASIMGASIIVIHPLHHLDYIEHGKKLREMSYEYMRRLLPKAEELGIVIGYENMWQRDRERGCIIANTGGLAEDLCEDIDRLSSPYIRACLDVGHSALVGEKPENAIRILGRERLKALHIHDNNLREDQHTLPFLGRLDWKAIASALSDIAYEGEFTYEADSFLMNLPSSAVPAALRLMERVGRSIIEGGNQ